MQIRTILPPPPFYAPVSMNTAADGVSPSVTQTRVIHSDHLSKARESASYTLQSSLCLSLPAFVQSLLTED